MILFLLSVPLCLCVLVLFPAVAHADDPRTITLRAWGVPNEFKFNDLDAADRAVVEAFRRKYPLVNPVSSAGLDLRAGGESENIVPFMQIAGDIAPDVLYVNFKMSQTYIGMKLLYPLDDYIERFDGVTLPDASALSDDDYIAALSKGKNWPSISERVLPQCWPVMRRMCPFGKDCPYRKARHLAPLADHRHVWCYPVAPLVMGLMYDRTLFAEHAAEGVQMRVPSDWEELMRWAKIMTNPPKGEFGFGIELKLPGWHFLTFLYSAGGRVVERDAHDQWHCVIDSDAAVDALYFYSRLRLEPVVRDGVTYRGVVGWGTTSQSFTRFGMEFEYLDDRFLAAAQNKTKAIGPVPPRINAPGAPRGSEFNTKMCGIFAGLADEPRNRDAAWDYINFYDSTEARRIRVEHFVQAGLGPFVRKRLLEQFNANGYYDSIIRQVSPELEETYRISWKYGVPEPYGKNCQYIYDELNRPIGAAWNNPIVQKAIDEHDPELARPVLKQILRRAKQQIDRKLLGILPPPVEARHNTVAWIVIALVVIIFTLVLRKVFQTFAPPITLASVDTAGATGGASRRSAWQFRKYRTAYILMLPALASIALWLYYPLVRGSIIAFQDYSILGDSHFIGAGNFATVLFSPEFWHSVKISLFYAALYFIFGFWVPIALAFLLQEVPRGKWFFRTIYYLPAVLSGLVVIFLWKEFYAPDGLLNDFYNFIATILNHIPGVHIQLSHQNWLTNPRWALFLTLLPTVWAGMGPGCLIYLAALKTVPEEMYEAADIDGAGIGRKVFSVALPSIRALITINFIGAMIGAVRGASSFVLAMTAGGPYTDVGGATEVFGLRLFFTTFGYLQFGVGSAMAWVLGSMLIGFTVLQLQRLSRYEFRTAKA